MKKIAGSASAADLWWKLAASRLISVVIGAVGMQVLWVEEQSYNRPCGAAVKGRQVGVGESGDCLHKVQQQEGQQKPEAAGLEA